MTLERLKSLGGALGSFGRSLIERAVETGRRITEVVGIARPIAPEVEVPEVAREWGQVRVAGERQEQFAGLAPDAYVSPNWFELSNVPWDKPLAYKVVAYGRDLATGQFAHQEWDITVSRPLTTEEALDEAQARLGVEGESPTMDIFSVKLVGASRREGEEWRW